jgi:hypothetical protein
MSHDETETLMKTANNCAEGECSLEVVSELISVLKEQQKELSARVQKVKMTIRDLEHVNEKDDRKVDEVRETVRAIFRVFQMGAKASGKSEFCFSHMIRSDSCSSFSHSNSPFIKKAMIIPHLPGRWAGRVTLVTDL